MRLCGGGGSGLARMLKLMLKILRNRSLKPKIVISNTVQLPNCI